MRRLGSRVRGWIWPPIDPYTTHLPVLIGLPRVRPVQRVLELGCGPFSTCTFLDRSIFPDLTELVSFETDPDWWQKLSRMTAGDGRLKLELVPRPMAETAARLDLTSFDLVFVDDSDNAVERSATIRAVLARPSGTAWLVLHDMENPVYREEVGGDFAVQRFETFVPNTWVVGSATQAAAVQSLGRLSAAIGERARSLRPDRREAWRATLSRLESQIPGSASDSRAE